MKMCSQPNPHNKTIFLKSPDSNKVREVIITEIIVPDSSSKKLSLVNKMEPVFLEKSNRKRRLDHLTIEEKIQRKKLKNREAAQTSRDRKKARLDELEITVKRLQQENELLCEDVQSLRDERDGLVKENAALHEELWRLRVEGSRPEGPAVSAHRPLPQGTTLLPPARTLPPLPLHPHQRPHHHQLQTPFPLLCLTLAISTGLAATAVAPISKSSRTLPIHSSSRRLHSRKQNAYLRAQPWWGRFQKAWNPKEKKLAPHRYSLQNLQNLPPLVTIH